MFVHPQFIVEPVVTTIEELVDPFLTRESGRVLGNFFKERRDEQASADAPVTATARSPAAAMRAIWTTARCSEFICVEI